MFLKSKQSYVSLRTTPTSVTVLHYRSLHRDVSAVSPVSLTLPSSHRTFNTHHRQMPGNILNTKPNRRQEVSLPNTADLTAAPWVCVSFQQPRGNVLFTSDLFYFAAINSTGLFLNLSQQTGSSRSSESHILSRLKRLSLLSDSGTELHDSLHTGCTLTISCAVWQEAELLLTSW